MKYDTVVIGGGLFGNIIGTALASVGQRVQIIDNHQANRGSDPAACLMKPGWLSKVKDLDHCLELLDGLYGVENLQFQMKPKLGTATVHWVDPEKILYPSLSPCDHRSGTVSAIVPGHFIEWNDTEHWQEQATECDNVVVAGGIWSARLVPSLRDRIEGKWGVAMRIPGQIAQPFIAPWAPFKQIVAFNIDPDHVWVGDGSAWKEFPTDERVEASVRRELEALSGQVDNGGVNFKKMIGVRPYAKTPDPCLLEEYGPDMWVATGGAKNGTAAAAWAALRLRERLM